jgi:hypothetical protein
MNLDLPRYLADHGTGGWAILGLAGVGALVLASCPIDWVTNRFSLRRFRVHWPRHGVLAELPTGQVVKVGRVYRHTGSKVLMATVYPQARADGAPVDSTPEWVPADLLQRPPQKAVPSGRR